MRTVYKYDIEISDDIQEIEVIPLGPIVHVGEQNGKLCFWKEGVVSPDTETIKMRVFGTGHSLTPHCRHLSRT